MLKPEATKLLVSMPFLSDNGTTTWVLEDEIHRSLYPVTVYSVMNVALMYIYMF